jgi:phytoene dehydrogenase-like protein
MGAAGRQRGRAAVVGSGHNGLVCAIFLARAGVPVTVLEQAPEPGGGLASGGATLPGFVHDTCAAFLPVAMVSPALRELGLDRLGIDWVNPGVAMAHPFGDGSAIGLHRDHRDTVGDLDAAAPGAGQGWNALVERTLPLLDQLAGSVFARLPPGRPALRVLAGLRRDALELVRLGVGSAEAFGMHAMGSERAAAWLAGSAMHSGLEPRAGASGVFGFLLNLLGHGVGWPFPRGGAGQVTGALVRLLREEGGELRCGARVERVLVRRGRASGVRLESGEELEAHDVVATVTARPLLAMLPDHALPERILTRLCRWRHGPGVFKLDHALAGPVPWASDLARRAGVVHVAGELRELNRSMQAANRGEVPDEPAMVVGQQSLWDDSRAPAGRHTLYAYTHVPAACELPDEAIAERMEARIERFAPGFSDLVLERALRSPAQLERQNPSMAGGDLAGGSYELDQQLVFRPAPELCRYRTPLRGLYVAGASVHPGGAIHGVSGREAARSLLNDRSALRFWR